jgi:hypothetical protein
MLAWFQLAQQLAQTAWLMHVICLILAALNKISRVGSS